MENEQVTPAEKPAKKSAKKSAKRVAKKVSARTSGPVTGVGELAYKLIAKHPTKTNQQITDMINKARPENKTTKDCVAWYRSKARRDAMENAKAAKKAEKKQSQPAA